jgi:enediyne biosynthesis thioesterase
MLFEYYRINANGEQLVAHGEQEIVCMQREGTRMVPTPIPAVLREALRYYADPLE